MSRLGKILHDSDMALLALMRLRQSVKQAQEVQDVSLEDERLLSIVDQALEGTKPSLSGQHEPPTNDGPFIDGADNLLEHVDPLFKEYRLTK